MFDLVVTRHKGLVEYLRKYGFIGADTEVIEHATKKAVRGKHVIGVLPHSLSCEAASFTEITLSLPVELRGIELSIEQVEKYAGEMVTYQVERIM